VKALELLTGGASRVETAEALGVHRSTVCRWLQDPTFAEELESAQQSLRQRVLSRLELLVPRALEALEQDLIDPDTPRPLRQRAALEVLTRAGFAGPKTPAVEVGVTVNTGGWDLTSLSDEELETLEGLTAKTRPAS